MDYLNILGKEATGAPVGGSGGILSQIDSNAISEVCACTLQKLN